MIGKQITQRRQAAHTNNAAAAHAAHNNSGDSNLQHNGNIPALSPTKTPHPFIQSLKPVPPMHPKNIAPVAIAHINRSQSPLISKLGAPRRFRLL